MPALMLVAARSARCQQGTYMAWSVRASHGRNVVKTAAKISRVLLTAGVEFAAVLSA